VKDGNGDLLADSHSGVHRWKSYISQLLTVHSISHVGQIAAAPLVLGPSHVEVAIKTPSDMRNVPIYRTLV
jgi:hypothetical protein